MTSVIVEELQTPTLLQSFP